MPLVLKDRVRETSTTTGTGSITLGGALAGFQSFSVIGNANTTYYGIVNAAANEWEIGIGTYTASGTVLSRDTILESSNSGSAVNFSAGTKDVFVTYPAEKAASLDTFPAPPVIGNTTPNAATFTTLTATGQTSLGGAEGSESLRVTPAASAVNYVEIFGASAADGRPLIRAAGASAAVELRLSSKSTSNISFWTNNAQNRQFQVTHTASAVNYVQVTGAATGGRVALSAQGSDASVAIDIQAKGTAGFVNLDSQRSNYLRVLGSFAAGGVATLSAVGSDTNIDLALTPKGTGLVRFGTYTAGAPTATGYISIKAADGTTYKVLVST